MRKCLIPIASTACLLIASGCCKGSKSNETTISQPPAEARVEQPQPAASEPQVVAPDQPVIIIEAEANPAPSESPAGNSSTGSSSTIALLVLAATAALVGWLVYKFIFRKR